MLIVVEAIDWVVLVASKKATVFARRQSQSKDPLLHCPPGAAVPQQVEIILANYGRSKDMGIIKLDLAKEWGHWCRVATTAALTTV